MAFLEAPVLCVCVLAREHHRETDRGVIALLVGLAPRQHFYSSAKDSCTHCPSISTCLRVKRLRGREMEGKRDGKSARWKELLGGGAWMKEWIIPNIQCQWPWERSGCKTGTAQSVLVFWVMQQAVLPDSSALIPNGKMSSTYLRALSPLGFLIVKQRITFP